MSSSWHSSKSNTPWQFSSVVVASGVVLDVWAGVVEDVWACEVEDVSAGVDVEVVTVVEVVEVVVVVHVPQRTGHASGTE